MSSEGRYSMYSHSSSLNNNYNSYPAYPGPPQATGPSGHPHHHPPPSSHSQQPIPPPLSSSSSYEHHPQPVVHAPPLRHTRSSTSSTHSQQPHYPPPPSSGGYSQPPSNYTNPPPPQTSSSYPVHVQSHHAQQSHPPQHWSPPPHQTFSTSPSSEGGGHWGHYTSQSHQNSHSPSNANIHPHHPSSYGPPPSSSSSSLSAHEHPTPPSSSSSKMMNFPPSDFSSSGSSYQGSHHQRVSVSNSGSYGLAPGSTTSASRRQPVPMGLAPPSSSLDDRQKHGSQQSASLPTTATPTQLQHNPQPPQFSSYSSSSQRYSSSQPYSAGPNQNYGSNQQQHQSSYHAQQPPAPPPSTTPTVFQPTPLPPATTPQPQYSSGPDNVEVQYRFQPHHQVPHRASQSHRAQPPPPPQHHPEPVSNTIQMVSKRRRPGGGKGSPTHLSSVGSSAGSASGTSNTLLSTTPGPVPVSSPQLTSNSLSSNAAASQHYQSHQPQQQPQYSPPSQVSVVQRHYPSRPQHHPPPPPVSHQQSHPQQVHLQNHHHPPPTHLPSSSSLSGYNGEVPSRLIGPGSSSSVSSSHHQTPTTAPRPPPVTIPTDIPDSPEPVSQLNGLDFMKLVESYRAILDSANTISAASNTHTRSMSGQNAEMDVSPEAMNVMQKNALYGMEVLDAALRIVRGESPSAPVSIPPPPASAPVNEVRMVGPGTSSVNAATTTTSSSSLAGAVTSPQEAASSTTPMPKTNTAVKPVKDVGNIRVIEDGPIKKAENKEGGGKSGDRKRQKTNDDNQHDGQTCLGCGATSTPEWRRGPMGPRTLCNACGLVYAKMMKKRYNNKPQGAKKPTSGKNNGGNSTQGMGSAMSGQMHVIAPEESADENSGAESYSTSQERRSEMAD